jgi:hypothetical protein
MMELDFVKLAIEYVNGVSINEDKQQLAQELLLRSKKIGALALKKVESILRIFFFLKKGR